MNGLFGSVVCFCLLSGLPLYLRSQTLSPDQWETLVSENNTTLVSDTFRLQRFNGTSQDNWNYTLQGTHSLIDASASGIEGVSNGKLLKLGLNSIISFEKAYTAFHSSIKGGLAYAPKGVMIGENMSVILYHGEEVETVVHSNVVSNDFSSKTRNIKINRNLYGLDLQTAPAAANTKNGYYGIDSVYLFGDIAHYSLFKGRGNWNDTTKWSHLPAERHRHGLVKGNILVSTDTHCDTVSLKGELTINGNAKLSLRQLYLHGISSSIKNEGSLQVEGKIDLIRSFPEKGVWYFVSFPFDVYTDGIDSSFALKDATPNSGGNYFYVLTYDSKRRNEEMITGDNWSVLPATIAFGNSPVFEKGKGYLLAIDESSDRTNLCFSSREGAIPQNLGQNGAINIDIPYKKGKSEVQTGWQLCGNPFPSPLHVSELNHPDLDGYVYYYTGEDYMAIPVTENYSIPPYSAFFLKAIESTTIELGVRGEEGAIQLAAPSPLRGFIAEPLRGNPTGKKSVDEFAFCRFTQTSFCIDNAPDKVTVTIINAAGLQFFSSSFSKGESGQIPLPARSGFYILWIQMQNKRIGYKFVR